MEPSRGTIPFVSLAAATLLLLAFQDAPALAKSGSEKFDRKDYEGAARDFSRALELDPKFVVAYIGRGLARNRLDARAEGLEDLTRAVTLDPARADGFFWRGTVYEDAGENRLAVRDYSHALELGLRDPLVFERRAYALNRLGEFEKAEVDATRALDAGRRSAGLYAFRGSLRQYLLDFRGGVADCSRAILLDPKDPTAYGQRFTAYFCLQSWDNALRDLQKQREMTGAPSDLSALWLYLVRARKGESDEAKKELRAHVAAHPQDKPSYTRSILSCLLGDLSDDDFLALPGPKGAAQSVLAHKRLLAGDTAGAESQFAKAVELLNVFQEQRFVARAELLAAGAARRREVLGELEKKFRALGPIEVRLEGEGQEFTQDSTFKNAILYLDLDRDRFQMVLTEHEGKRDRDFETTILYEQMALFKWGGSDGIARKADFAPFMTAGLESGKLLGAEIDRILPPDPAQKEKEEVLGPRLTLSVDGKPDKSGSPTFVFQYGRGSRPNSWLAEGTSAADAVLHEAESTVKIEIPSKRRTIVIDRKTGFFQSIEARDYDGVGVRTLKVTSLRKVDAFPELKRPPEFQPLPIDFKKLISELSNQRIWLSEALRDTVERWDKVAAAGKEDEVRAVFTRWASKVEDGLYAWGVRQLARKHVQSLIDLGTPVETILKDADAESKRFAERMATQWKDLMDFLEGQVALIRIDVEDDVFRTLLDNRLHGRLREVLERSLRFESVERLRRDTYGERLDALFRDELSTFRQL